jgi:insertion element IS1 protein InsB
MSNPSKDKEILLLPVVRELDEHWSLVGDKSHPRWLWLALDHDTSEVLAYTFGPRTDAVFNALKNWLKPFNIKRYFTDGLGAYMRGLPEEHHEEGKRNTQKIERKYLANKN